MKKVTWTLGGAGLLLALLAAAPMKADAQPGPRGWRGAAITPRGAGVEMLLRQKERLELSDAQVRQLEQIRQEAVKRRAEHQAQMAELRSKVRAGMLPLDSLRKQAQARREAAAAVQEAQRARVEGVLTDAQKKELQEWAAEARAFRMGRRSAMPGMRGVGPRMHPGWGPGRFGPIRGGAMMRGGRGWGWGFRSWPDSAFPG